MQTWEGQMSIDTDKEKLFSRNMLVRQHLARGKTHLATICPFVN